MSTLAVLLGFAVLLLLGCQKDDSQPNQPVPPEVPAVTLQVHAGSYVPHGIATRLQVQLGGEGLPDSLVVFRDGARHGSVAPLANPGLYDFYVTLEDTVTQTELEVEAWWEDSLLATARDSVLALSFDLESSAPESLYVGQVGVLAATLTHPLLFSQVRIRAAGLDTMVTPPQTLESFTLSVLQAYDSPRTDTVRVSAVLSGATTLSELHVLDVLPEPEEPWITGELILTNASGTAPLAVHGQILAYPERFVDSLWYASGDGWDTVIVEPDSSTLFAYVYTEFGDYTARLQIFGADSVVERTSEVAVGELPPISYTANFSVTPSEGDAPLFSQLSLAVESSRPDTLQIVFSRGIGEDSLFERVTPFTVLLQTTYDVGDYEVSVEAVGRDSTLAFSRGIHANNTSPVLNLPNRTAYEDSSMAPIDLDGTAHDQQTPDSLLQFQIFSQNGPVLASLENHVLNFALTPEASGQGSIALRVTDEHGAFTDRTLNYTVLPMTDLRISLADLETLEPLSNGIVNINGQDYAFGDALHTQVTPGGIIPVRAVHTLNDAINSFERTSDINTSSDRDTTILVSTYDALQEENVTPFRYRTYIGEGRHGLAFIGGEWREVLKKINFTNANQGFENGGYTWWIGKTNPQNGLQWTDQEQTTIEDMILAEINANIRHAWARLPTHRATLEDSSYFIEGYGTTRDGLIPNYKSLNMSFVGVYDRNFDGTIEAAYIEIIQWIDQNSTIAENLSAIAFPNQVGLVDSTLHPHETVLHLASTHSTMSRLDIKALNEAINLPPAEELDRVYHIRE